MYGMYEPLQYDMQKQCRIVQAYIEAAETALASNGHASHGCASLEASHTCTYISNSGQGRKGKLHRCVQSVYVPTDLEA